jgi:hypothetical protein
MAERQIDPSRLQGEALRSWYLRSPQDFEQERQAAQARRYDEFFRATPSADIDPRISRRPASLVWDADPGISLNLRTASTDIDPGISWVSTGANRWRGVNASSTPSTSNSRALSAPGNAGGWIQPRKSCRPAVASSAGSVTDGCISTRRRRKTPPDSRVAYDRTIRRRCLVPQHRLGRRRKGSRRYCQRRR